MLLRSQMLKTWVAEFGCQDARCTTNGVEQRTLIMVASDRDKQCPRPYQPRKPAAVAAALRAMRTAAAKADDSAIDVESQAPAVMPSDHDNRRLGREPWTPAAAAAAFGPPQQAALMPADAAATGQLLADASADANALLRRR